MKTKIDFGLPKATWPAPKLYGVGNFTEFGLYQVALTIAKINGFINQEVLMSETRIQQASAKLRNVFVKALLWC